MIKIEFVQMGELDFKVVVWTKIQNDVKHDRNQQIRVGNNVNAIKSLTNTGSKIMLTDFKDVQDYDVLVEEADIEDMEAPVQNSFEKDEVYKVDEPLLMNTDYPNEIDIQKNVELDEKINEDHEVLEKDKVEVA